MKLNERGEELYNIWEKKYFEENDRRGGDSQNGDFIDGWSIIDTRDFIRNITDECGILVYGYRDNAIWTVAEWIDDGDNWENSRLNVTYCDVIQELLQYFNVTPEETNELDIYLR